MTWTREHDRVIAEKCEGAKPRKERGMPDRLWKYEFPGGEMRFLPDYSTDLVAVVRAAEAWRKGEDTDARSWSINTHGLDRDKPFRAIVQIWDISRYSKFPVSHSTPAAALAHALYQAVSE